MNGKASVVVALGTNVYAVGGAIAAVGYVRPMRNVNDQRIKTSLMLRPLTAWYSTNKEQVSVLGGIGVGSVVPDGRRAAREHRQE